MKGEMKYTPEDMARFAEAYVNVYRGCIDPCFPHSAEAMRKEAAENMLNQISIYNSFPQEVRDKTTISRTQVSELRRMCEKAEELKEKRS